jgi:putative transposase-like DNA-binding protein
VDVGVAVLAVLSTGERVPNPEVPVPLAAADHPPPAGAVPAQRSCKGTAALEALAGFAHPPLSERMFRCDNTACGLVIDRDLNAALNLAALVRAIVTGTASSGGNRLGDHPACAQGEERSMDVVSPRCSSVNCEDGPGRSRSGKTATVTRQRVAPEPALIGSDR